MNNGLILLWIQYHTSERVMTSKPLGAPLPFIQRSIYPKWRRFRLSVRKQTFWEKSWRIRHYIQISRIVWSYIIWNMDGINDYDLHLVRWSFFFNLAWFLSLSVKKKVTFYKGNGRECSKTKNCLITKSLNKFLQVKHHTAQIW